MNRQDWKKEDIMTIGMYLLELMRAALLDRKAPEKPESISWNDLCRLAKMHNVESMMVYGMESLENKPPKELWEQVKKLSQYVIYRGVRFDIEREAILAQMRKAGLAYLPLKGIHLANYYPKQGMRSMADNDILFGYVELAENGGWKRKGATLLEEQKNQEQAAEELHRIMQSLGYEGEITGYIHDVYKKQPIFNFEMHKGLVAETSEFYEYYEEPWIRAIQKKETLEEFYFSDEDEYIYLLTHAYKHFSGGGCGIRLLADMHVFEVHKGAQLNRQYIAQELKRLGLQEFEDKLTGLTRAILGKQRRALDEAEMEMLLYMLSAGTYGTVENFVLNKVKRLATEKGTNDKIGKLLYMKNRIFPDKEWWKKNYPVTAEKPYLIPFCWVYRMIVKSFTKRDKVMREIKICFSKEKS